MGQVPLNRSRRHADNACPRHAPRGLTFSPISLTRGSGSYPLQTRPRLLNLLSNGTPRPLDWSRGENPLSIDPHIDVSRQGRKLEMLSQECGHLTYNTLLNRAAASGFCRTTRDSLITLLKGALMRTLARPLLLIAPVLVCGAFSELSVGEQAKK